LSEHLTAAELELFLAKELTPQRMGELGQHLVQECQICCALLGRAERPSYEPLTPEETAEYDRVVTSLSEWIVRQEVLFKQGDSLVRTLAMIEAAKVGHVFTDQDQALQAYEALLQESWALRHDKPCEMVKLAYAAVHVAQDLDPAIYGAQQVADYQARAWGELGNAHRVADRHWEAEQAFGKAFQLFKRGTKDRFLKVRLHDLYASLLGTQRKFEFAFQNLDIVADLYMEIDDQHSAGRTLLTKAIYKHYSGRSAEALIINQQGLAQIDEKRDPGLPVNALHNHLCFLVACGRFKDAKILLFKSRRKISDTGRILATKVRWLEGQISYGMEDYEAAESTFQEVMEIFETEGLGFAAALASLDIAMAQMRLGKYGEAKEGAIEAAGVFAALNIHCEVLGAVELLRDAFRIDKATIALIERVVAFIREWEINPEARFLSPSE
jgi:tetratricopeptide (TPR) repeat protein